jgi:L-lactate utilization protein LutC
MPTKQYLIGKPFDISELKKPARARVVSPREQELEKAITQAAAGAASQVIPFSFDPEKDKIGTVKAAAKRIVARMEVPVNVGTNAALFPNAILLSRGVLSNRGRRSR